MNTQSSTDPNQLLIGCRTCHLLCRISTSRKALQTTCPRCGAKLQRRKPGSIARTWALVIAAYIFYLPANLLPITKYATMGEEQMDTIMSGVIYFVVNGSWYIAIIIFTASVMVPILKLIVLTYLLVSVNRKSERRRRERARLYRITATIGRWSMVDIYALTILVALVKLGPVATIEAGPGAVFFAAVVVLTMLAARAFDPRLIWDAKESINE